MRASPVQPHPPGAAFPGSQAGAPLSICPGQETFSHALCDQKKGQKLSITLQLINLNPDSGNGQWPARTRMGAHRGDKARTDPDSRPQQAGPGSGCGQVGGLPFSPTPRGEGPCRRTAPLPSMGQLTKSLLKVLGCAGQVQVLALPAPGSSACFLRHPTGDEEVWGRREPGPSTEPRTLRNSCQVHWTLGIPCTLTPWPQKGSERPLALGLQEPGTADSLYQAGCPSMVPGRTGTVAQGLPRPGHCHSWVLGPSFSPREPSLTHWVRASHPRAQASLHFPPDQVSLPPRAP